MSSIWIGTISAQLGMLHRNQTQSLPEFNTSSIREEPRNVTICGSYRIFFWWTTTAFLTTRSSCLWTKHCIWKEKWKTKRLCCVRLRCIYIYLFDICVQKLLQNGTTSHVMANQYEEQPINLHHLYKNKT